MLRRLDGRRSHGARGFGPSVATIARTIDSACSSSSAKWSVTPLVRECRSPPPSSSAVTSSPVAAFTSGGPPRKIVPCSRTITHSSLIAGTYAPPAVHEPIPRRSAGSPPGHRRLVEEDPAEVLAVGEDVVLQRQERAAGVHEVDARQPVVQGHLLRAQVLLDRHRVVRAALDGRVVGDDHALAARHPADAGDDPRARRVAVVHAVRGQRRELQERRALVQQPVHALARQQLPRATCAARGPSRRRPSAPARAAR